MIPSHYQLEYTYVDLRACVFEGNVVISLTPDGTSLGSNSLTLNAQELDLQSVSIGGLDVDSISYSPKTQRVTLTWDQAGVLDTACDLRISFTGILNDALAGK